jgi:hypothetical protein
MDRNHDIRPFFLLHNGRFLLSKRELNETHILKGASNRQAGN